MNTKLIAFRISEDIEKIMNKSMCDMKIKDKTEFMKLAILKLSGYIYIPAQIIKKDRN